MLVYMWVYMCVCVCVSVRKHACMGVCVCLFVNVMNAHILWPLKVLWAFTRWGAINNPALYYVYACVQLH